MLTAKLSPIETFHVYGICFMLKVVCHRRSVDTNLVKIHAEMSKLLDKQVYVLNECFKYKFRDSRWGSRKPTKSVR